MDSGLAARISALSPEQRKLFLQTLQKKGLSSPIQLLPRRSGSAHEFPLSSAQERLWFLHQLEPESPLYNIPTAVRCRGQVDIAVLERCFNEIVRRHETLRTTFRTENGRPVQVVAPALHIPFVIEDLRQVPLAEQTSQIDRWIAAEAILPFDLEHGPLIRMIVLLLNEEEHVQLLTLHHIIGDAWSAGVLVSELWSLYDAFLHERPSPLAALPVQYADYAVWQRNQIQAHVLDAQLSFWTEHLSGTLPVIELTPDRPRPFSQSFRGAVESLALPPALVAAIKTLSQTESATPFMTVLAAFNTLLYRYTGQQDILLGSPISNRSRTEIEGLIGCFVNMLVLRTDLSGDPSFRTLLNRARQTALQAYAHPDLPFERLVEVLHPTRSTSRSPLFQISFGQVHNPLVSLQVPGQVAEITPLRTHTGMSKFDLTLEMSDAVDGSITITAEYSSDLFDAATIRRMLEHLQTILEQVVVDADRSITTLPLLTAGEWQQLAMWNQTAAERPDLPAHRLFEQQVRRSPRATALTITKDLDHIYAALQPDNYNPATLDTLGGIYAATMAVDKNAARRSRANADSATVDPDFAHCCFRKNPYIHRFGRRVLKNAVDDEDLSRLNLLRTHLQNLVVVSDNLLDLLEYFDGESNLRSLATRMEQQQEFWVGFVVLDNQSVKLKLNKLSFRPDQSYQSWVPLIKALYMAYLIDLVAYDQNTIDGPAITVRETVPDKLVVAEDSPIEMPEPPMLHTDKGPVLLLGETIGTASIGIAYLASFLRRHGVEAYCQLNDFSTEHTVLRNKVHSLLDRYKPKIVGVSLKWFPHMARGLEICRLIKDFSPDITVVLGGDTATYFADRFIQHDCVDYVVLGDGELPFLEICLGAEHIPNCLYKRNGELVRTPVGYLHTRETFSQVYLSHLDELFISPADLSVGPYLFIFTGRGCPMNCHYCGGARDVQVQAFNRPKPYSSVRGAVETRHDIILLKPYTSTFLFDFDTPNFDSLENYRALWDGIDLTDHFGYFYFWSLPTTEFIELVVKTFKYVYLNIDLNSLSERHRLQLSHMRFGKPQPRDQEILDFFAACDRFGNVESTINLINGLPHFGEEDIALGHKLLSQLLHEHPSFVGLGWGRLHAQPGAPLTRKYAQWGMRPSAQTFDDFMQYSQLNMQERFYPDLSTLHYPLVYYQDDALNSKVGKYYVDVMQRIKSSLEQRQKKVRHYTENLSYAELNARANQLAHALRRRGVGPETLVGIYLERSVEQVLAILAVFKAGAAYVPLDPAYPKERLAFMLQDADVSALITQEWLAHELTEQPAMVVCIARDWSSIEREPTHDLDVEVTTDQLAYVLYTSGSTGLPKGVMVQHRSIGNLAMSQRDAFDIRPESRVLQFAPFAFDASVSEIFVTLLSGATLCIATQDALLPGPELVALLRDQQISVVTLPPSVQAALPDTDFPALETLVSAGEACGPELAARWAPGRRYINAYGPTEGTVCAALELVAGADGTPPIGRPIANTHIYLVDRSFQPVPVGVPGEIVFGGVGLARGYRGRPDLTAERFVPNPFAGGMGDGGWGMEDASPSQPAPCATLVPHLPSPGTRLYRTGDMGRFLPDGRIEFLGRADQQVKIRGARVELGEVETVLGQHPAVREAVVMSWQVASDTRLVAYVVPVAQQALSQSELRSFMATRLPDYMLPSTFMYLDAMPLTPNGKIDRRGLPAPDQTRPDLDERYVAPRTPVEEVVAHIWAECLNIERVGVHDNFFELGGYSLLITQVLSRVRDVFQVELPTRTFLEGPTVGGVVQELIKNEAAPGQVEAIAQLRVRLSQMSADEVRELLREKKLGRKVTFNGF